MEDEDAVLAAAMLAKSAHESLLQLGDEDFTTVARQTIASTIRDMIRRGQDVTTVTVAAALESTGHLRQCGGAVALHEMCAALPTATNADWYAVRVRKATRRRMYREATERMGRMLIAEESLDGLAEAVMTRDVEESRIPGDLGDAHPETHILEAMMREVDGPAEWLIPGLIERGERIVLTGHEGHGKALALDTPIPTPIGWSTMGDLSVGDEVIGADGMPTRIIAATDVMAGRPCYRITFSDGETVVADAQHQWLTETYQSRIRTAAEARRGPTKPRGTDQRHKRLHHPAVVTTREIHDTLWARGGHTRNHSIDPCRPLDLLPRDLQIDPYVLGAWLGDGTTTRAEMTCAPEDAPTIIGGFRAAGYTARRNASKYGWSISRRGAREDAIQQVRDLIDSGMNRRAAERTVGLPRGAADSIPVSNSDRGWKLNRRSTSSATRIQSFVEDLRDVGVLGNKHIPTEYLRASFDQRLALLQGLMDTDGTISDGRGNGRGKGAALCEFSVTCKHLADGVVELLHTLGIIANVRSGDATLYGRVTSTRWRITFQTELPVFRLPRKAERIIPLRTARARHRMIMSVEPIESVPVRCIQVDNADHMYLAGRAMVPTHNSVIMRQIAACAAAGVHPWTGLPSGRPPCRVLHVDAENSRRQIRNGYRMVRRIGSALPAGWEQRITVHVRADGLDLPGRDAGWLHQVAAECSPDLIVIGPAYKLMLGDPQKDRDVLALLSVLDSVRIRHNAAMIIEHHSPHGDSTFGSRTVRPYGSSVWRRWPEVGIGVAAHDMSKEGEWQQQEAAKWKRPQWLDIIDWRPAREDRDWPALIGWGAVGELPWKPYEEYTPSIRYDEEVSA